VGHAERAGGRAADVGWWRCARTGTCAGGALAPMATPRSLPLTGDQKLTEDYVTQLNVAVKRLRVL